MIIDITVDMKVQVLKKHPSEGSSTLGNYEYNINNNRLKIIYRSLHHNHFLNFFEDYQEIYQNKKYQIFKINFIKG